MHQEGSPPPPLALPHTPAFYSICIPMYSKVLPQWKVLLKEDPLLSHPISSHFCRAKHFPNSPPLPVFPHVQFLIEDRVKIVETRVSHDQYLLLYFLIFTHKHTQGEGGVTIAIFLQCVILHVLHQ